MGKLLVLPWEVDAPCNTHGCYNRISHKLVPEAFRDVTAGVLVGLCDECISTVAESLAEPKEDRRLSWPEVDKFLREHKGDEVAVPIVEGAMGKLLVDPEQRDPEVARQMTKQIEAAARVAKGGTRRGGSPRGATKK